MAPNFVVVVNLLMHIYCNFGSSMPYLHISVKEINALLCAMTGKWE